MALGRVRLEGYSLVMISTCPDFFKRVKRFPSRVVSSLRTSLTLTGLTKDFGGILVNRVENLHIRVFHKKLTNLYIWLRIYNHAIQRLEAKEMKDSPTVDMKSARNGDLDVDRRSWFNIDYLRAAAFEKHSLGVVKLTIEYPNFMVLVADNSEAELSV
jgi:hypothetical protein